MPTEVIHKIAASGGDYTSLAAWEADQQRNLVTADEIAIAECYAFIDTTTCTISGWTTDSTRYVVVRAHPSARSTMPMTLDGSRYLMQLPGGTPVLNVSQNFTRVSDIQVRSTTAAPSTNTFRITGNSCIISNVIVVNSNSGDLGGSYFLQGGSNTQLINCVGIMTNGTGRSDVGAFRHDNATNIRYDNCLAYVTGIRHGFRPSVSRNTTVRNCLAVVGTGNGFQDLGNAYNTTFSTNNATNGSQSPPGANARASQTFTFVNSASLNLRLRTTDEGALTQGINLSTSTTGSFNYTFDGFSRGQIWSIGPTQHNSSANVVYNVTNGPKIVTDGLVLCLDAGNRKSYAGSGTSWVDLSGNGNTGTLTNGPTFNSANGGSIVFDGTNDYVAPTGLTDAVWQGNWTVSFWVNFDRLNTTTAGATDNTLLQHGTSTTRQGLHLTQRNSRIHFGLFDDDLQATIVLSTGTWYNVVFTLNNSTRVKQNYLNGNLDNSHTGGGAYTGTGSNTRIGGIVLNFGSYFDGFMSSCNVYNRVLTATEVLQNYNATRSRFGV